MAAKYRGCWVPRSRYGLSARRTHGPSGISSSARAQGRDSLDNPLLGFGPPTRLFPLSPPAASRPKAPLLGFFRPYNAHRKRESTSRRFYPVELPGFAGNLPASPTLPATVSSAGFPNLSTTFFLSPPPRHFQTDGARGILLFRDLIFPRSPGCSSPPVCPLDVPPPDCAVPVPRRGHPVARRSCS
jgi:hypothetical protein